MELTLTDHIAIIAVSILVFTWLRDRYKAAETEFSDIWDHIEKLYEEVERMKKPTESSNSTGSSS
jgi:molybdopterin converting factor small subunit